VIFIRNERFMVIDSSKIQRYFMFVHVGSSLITESDLTTLYCAFGDSTQPALDSTAWKNAPQKNVGYDPDLDVFHIDYNIYDEISDGAIQYYSHDPGAATLIHDQSWIWVKFQRGSKIYIDGAEIGDNEIRVSPAEDNTQYIGTHIYVENQVDPDPDPEPDPPTPTGRKYRIYVKREDKHSLIDNENILVGNTRGDGKSKETSGMTMGAEYSYVEFNSWQELTDAAGGGSGPTPPPGPTEYLTISISKDSFAHEGGQAVLSIDSNTGWEIITSNWITVRGDTTGSGSLVMEVEIDENVMSSEERTGYITVTTSGGLIRSIQVVQRAGEGEISYKLILGMNQMSVSAGETAVITATYQTYQDGQLIRSLDVTDYESVTWYSTDVGVAKVETGGRVTGVFEGSAQINATYEGAESDWTLVNVY
jgi:hypothetical protein